MYVEHREVPFEMGESEGRVGVFDARWLETGPLRRLAKGNGGHCDLFSVLKMWRLALLMPTGDVLSSYGDLPFGSRNASPAAVDPWRVRGSERDPCIEAQVQAVTELSEGGE